MEAQVKPSTPPKVLEERRNAARDVLKRIKEAEELCAKSVNQVSHTWEALINNDKLEKTKEHLHATKAEVK